MNASLILYMMQINSPLFLMDNNTVTERFEKTTDPNMAT